MSETPPVTLASTPSGATSPLRKVPTAVLFVAVASFWGLNAVASRVASRYAPALSIATVRSIVGGLLLLAVARRRGADWPRGRAEWVGIVWIAATMTGVSTAALFLAARNAPAGLVSIFSNTMPLFVAVLAPLLLREAVTGRAALGLAVGLTGTILVAWRAIHGEVRPIGVIYGLLASVTAAFGSMMYKRHPLPRLDRIMVVGVQLMLSAVVLGLLAAPDDRSHIRVTAQLMFCFVYLSVCGLALSFVCWSELLSRTTTMQSSSAAYLATVLGVLFGALFLGERLSWSVLVGGAIAIAGVALVQTAPRRAVGTATPADVAAEIVADAPGLAPPGVVGRVPATVAASKSSLHPGGPS